MPTADEVIQALNAVEDPEIGIGIVDLGLVYDAKVNPDGTVKIDHTLTSPFCPVGPMIQDNIKSVVEGMEGVKSCELELVWTPPWDPRTMASDYAKDMLGIW